MLGRGQSSDYTHYSSGAVHRTLNRYLHTAPSISEDDSVGDTRGGQLDEQQVQCVVEQGREPRHLCQLCSAFAIVLQKVPSEDYPKVRNHGEGPY